LAEASCHATNLGVTDVWRFTLALAIFTKHNGLSCLACWTDRNENQGCLSNVVRPTTYTRWSWTAWQKQRLQPVSV